MLAGSVLVAYLYSSNCARFTGKHAPALYNILVGLVRQCDVCCNPDIPLMKIHVNCIFLQCNM